MSFALVMHLCILKGRLPILRGMECAQKIWFGTQDPKVMPMNEFQLATVGQTIITSGAEAVTVCVKSEFISVFRTNSIIE